MAGAAVGRSMDDVDRLKTSQTLETMRTGVSSSWRNPDTGNQYAVTPTRTCETGPGPCREYVINGKVVGKP
jgi:surface antigen